MSKPKGFGRDAWLPLLAILVLAFNLRPVAISVGPVLGSIVADLRMGGATAGLLTSLPAICFAAFGAVSPALSRRFGPHRTVGAALVLLIIAQFARAWVGSSAAFIACSVIALAGMAVANVLLPSLVRLYFPHRVGLATSLYSLVMTIGVTLASAGTVPLALALGGWRAAFTAATGIAVAALLCWLPMLRQPRSGARAPEKSQVTVPAVGRTRMGWAMAVFFGIQSAQAYTIFGWLPTIYSDAGMSKVGAGLMLGIATGAGIIPSFVVPAYTERNTRPVGVFLIIMGFLTVGYIGLMWAPMTLPWLWAVCLALGTASFPLILALLGLRARTSTGTAALSGFTQSVGYTIAAFGPFIVGIIQAATGSWVPVLAIQLGLVVPMTIVGWVVCRKNWSIEDELQGVSLAAASPR